MTRTKTALGSRTVTKAVPDLTPEQFAECESLTLVGIGRYGSMQPRLHERRNDPDVFATFLRDTEGKMVGWALTFRDRYHYADPQRYHTYFFVDEDMRRQGIGTRLYRSVRRKFGIVTVHPWDGPSRGFFNSVKARG